MLGEWAARWGIPTDALRELVAEVSTPRGQYPDGSEAAVQAHIRVKASEQGMRLWRNNVGAYQDERGRFIRYGLCNESSVQNKKLKSADLIGIKPVLVTAAHVGTTIGQFAAVEVKEGNWKPGVAKRERAQAMFLAIVRQLGGYGVFSTGELPDG